ncbi:MAG: macro domain-containing protein [Spirochaetaceae bacterium]|nr:macro domain-containing protein [Spirochaetaceae bacterium]
MNKNIEIVRGDITRQKVDAIVNCGTTKVVIGGGALDTAIHKAAGPDLREECLRIMDKKRAIVIGECIVTDAYKLPCKKVIHTAGPIYMGGGWQEAENLASCYTNSLFAADEAACESIAFPSLCTGSHSYPLADAARIACDAVRAILPSLSNIKRVVFVCLDEETERAYERYL